MNIAIYRISEIYKALSELSNIKLPIKTAWKIYKITDAFSDQVKFITEEEKKIINENNGTIDGTGNIKFSNDIDTQKFVKEINEFHNTELECNFETVELAIDDLADCKLEPKLILSLKDIVIFK